MSGTFEHIDVPPTLVSFAVTTGAAGEAVSPEFKEAGHTVVLMKPEYDENGLPVARSLKTVFETVTRLIRTGAAISAYTPVYGGVAEGVLKMCMGNGIGFRYDEKITNEEIFAYSYGSFILELTHGEIGTVLGRTIAEKQISREGESVSLDTLCRVYEGKLESVYACNIPAEGTAKKYTYSDRGTLLSTGAPVTPKVLIPVFPGTNCEYDTAKAFADAGAQPEIFVVRNRTQEEVARSAERFAAKLKESQIVFIPGGFSGGDEPDGSGKFIATTFKNPAVAERIMELLNNRDGLALGICNGFQALIKLGLVPYGKVSPLTANSPTLTYNNISRHVSTMVNIRVASNLSPWLSGCNVGEVYAVPVSHGEGKIVAPAAELEKMLAGGQIATQYVDLSGKPTMQGPFNPNGSMWAIEGITSPDGRVFGKMGHSERVGENLYKNYSGNFDMKIFESGVKYFK